MIVLVGMNDLKCYDDLWIKALNPQRLMICLSRKTHLVYPWLQAPQLKVRAIDRLRLYVQKQEDGKTHHVALSAQYEHRQLGILDDVSKICVVIGLMSSPVG